MARNGCTHSWPSASVDSSTADSAKQWLKTCLHLHTECAQRRFLLVLALNQCNVAIQTEVSDLRH